MSPAGCCASCLRGRAGAFLASKTRSCVCWEAGRSCRLVSGALPCGRLAGSRTDTGRGALAAACSRFAPVDPVDVFPGASAHDPPRSGPRGDIAGGRGLRPWSWVSSGPTPAVRVASPASPAPVTRGSVPCAPHPLPRSAWGCAEASTPPPRHLGAPGVTAGHPFAPCSLALEHMSAASSRGLTPSRVSWCDPAAPALQPRDTWPRRPLQPWVCSALAGGGHCPGGLSRSPGESSRSPCPSRFL